MPLRTAGYAFGILLLLSCGTNAQNSANAPKRKASQPPTAEKALAIPYTPGLDPTAMDKKVDPCVDFYAYSCGGWQKANPLPADQASWGVYGKLQEENQHLLKDILEQAAAAKGKRTANQQKIGDFYFSCMNEEAVNVLGPKAIEPDLQKIAALHSKDELPPLLAYLHPRDIGVELGRAAFFGFGSMQDFKNSEEMIAVVDQGGLGLPDRDYYLKDDAKSKEIRQKYLAHVQNMLELAGEKPEAAQKDAQTVMRIETALAKGAMSRVDRRDPYKVYHRMSRQDLQALTQDFNWDKYLAALSLNVDSLNVTDPDFFKAMNTVLQSETIGAWQAYLRWHLIHAQARWLSSPFVDEDFSFYGRTLSGQQVLQPRWKRCVRYTDRGLGEALGEAYVKVAFSPETRQRALKMVEQIEAAMQQDIQQLPWMSEPTKQQATVKLHAVVNKIGYPDHWRDYSALKIVRGDALGNGERANEFEFRRQLNKIGKPVDRTEWYMTPPTVDANYDPSNNDVNFPAGVLQPPLFDPKMDDAPNYGDTGSTIGHELTHGFDDEGRQFDAKGNLRDWWQPQDARQFDARAQCIVDQYAQYTVVDDIKINSKLTLGEDIADVGGLILAYMAWQDQTKGQDLKPIDGFSPDQRFFIGYAQQWCSNERPELERMRAITNPHSPPKYRTNGVVVNMPEFQKAFACKTGQPMAPEKRCRVW